MIPFQGLIAEVFAVIGLVRFWRHPLPGIWWTLLIVFFAEWFLCHALKKEIFQSGDMRSGRGFLIPVTLLQFAEIGIGIYSFF
jgi:hypothetical protein